MTDLKIVTLHESNFRDPVATLRLIASQIERGEHGDVACIALAMLADEFSVFGMGPEGDAPSVALLFQAGSLRLTRAIERVGQK